MTKYLFHNVLIQYIMNYDINFGHNYVNLFSKMKAIQF